MFHETRNRKLRARDTSFRETQASRETVHSLVLVLPPTARLTPSRHPFLKMSLLYIVQVYFDYDEDEVMAARRGKFLSLTNQEGLLFMRQRGYEHVQMMLAEGKLDCIKEAALCRRTLPED